MKLHLATNKGFCRGVKYAVSLADEIVKKDTKEKKYFIGQLVHNEFVSQKYKEIPIISFPNKLEPGLALIRSHGISKELFNEFKKKNFTLIDGTCGIVKNNQKLISELQSPTIVIGEKIHPEVQALLSYARSPVIVVEKVEDINGISKEITYNLMVQTTFKALIYTEIVKYLDDNNYSYKVLNKICPASSKRRKSIRELCEFCDNIIVVGDANSSNSQALKALASDLGRKSFLVSKSGDITLDMLDCDNLGLSAGASAPDELIDLIIAKIKTLAAENHF